MGQDNSRDRGHPTGGDRPQGQSSLHRPRRRAIGQDRQHHERQTPGSSPLRRGRGDGQQEPQGCGGPGDAEGGPGRAGSDEESVQIGAGRGQPGREKRLVAAGIRHRLRAHRDQRDRHPAHPQLSDRRVRRRGRHHRCSAQGEVPDPSQALLRLPHRLRTAHPRGAPGLRRRGRRPGVRDHRRVGQCLRGRRHGGDR